MSKQWATSCTLIFTSVQTLQPWWHCFTLHLFWNKYILLNEDGRVTFFLDFRFIQPFSTTFWKKKMQQISNGDMSMNFVLNFKIISVEVSIKGFTVLAFIYPISLENVFEYKVTFTGESRYSLTRRWTFLLLFFFSMSSISY